MKNFLISLFTVLVLAGVAAFSAPSQAATSVFTFAGSTDSGAHTGQSFSGSFAFDGASVPAGFSGNLALTSFAMSFLGQAYTLATADVPAQAVFDAGKLLGLDYADVDSTSAARPQVSLVPGLPSLADAYLAYAPVDTNLLPGFGSFTVTAVPEPGSLVIFAAGLGLLGRVVRRRTAICIGPAKATGTPTPHNASKLFCAR